MSTSLAPLVRLALYFLLGGLTCLAQAGGFSLQPLRLTLGGNVRSAALTLRNDDAHPQTFGVSAMAWQQDESGADVYTEAQDLVYYPRQVTLGPGQEGVVRVGARQGSGPIERTYRVFIEQLPSPTPPEGAEASGGARLQVMLKIGAPLFVTPLAPRRSLSIEGLHIEQGQVRWALVNTGNRHERIEALTVHGLDASGDTALDSPIEARYLLAGRQRAFSVDLDPEVCKHITRVTISVRTDAGTRDNTLTVPPTACP